MKAAELMVGDMVRFKTETKRIKSIQSYYGSYRVSFFKDYDWIYLKFIEPIPLTHEILEKNGFWVMRNVDNGAEEYVSYAIDGFSFHWNRDNGYYIPNTPISWQNVHEMQHVLRVCGFTELADNFKI